jgi:methyl-accepting chemotaxis protein
MNKAVGMYEELSSKKISRMILIINLLLMFSMAVALLVMRLISTEVRQPLLKLTGYMQTMADGNYGEDEFCEGRADEIGAMAKALGVFRLNHIKMLKLEEQQKEMEELAKQERQQLMLNMADSFENKVGQIVESVSAAAEQLQATAQTMTSLSDETNNQALTVADSSEQSSANISTVSAATEELSSSINEIARQVTHSSEIATSAVKKSTDANSQVNSLTDSVARIGKVVEMINAVAEKTNLLALNATIEAARAGDAGKGFAVVADEVKMLAQQTSEATDKIRNQIIEIESATSIAASSIQEIGVIIEENDEIVASIAGAVEEQGSATSEIARNVELAAASSLDVNTSIKSVTSAARETGSASSDVLSAARELGQNAGLLAKEMQEFLVQIRS